MKYVIGIGAPVFAVAVVLASAGIAESHPVSNPKSAKPKANLENQDLDEQLLEGLEDELGDDLEVKTIAKKRTAKPVGGADIPTGDTTDKELFEDLDVGEDIKLDSEGEPVGDEELGEEVDPLTPIGKKMRLVERLLSERDASDPTQKLQDEIVSDLDALMKQLIQQIQQQQASKSEKKQKQSTRTPFKLHTKPKPGQHPGNRESKKPAEDSEDRVRPPRRPEIDLAELAELQKDVWGHLPEKVREQMRQSPNEEFLPQYELLIQEYFRRLAEEENELP